MGMADGLDWLIGLLDSVRSTKLNFYFCRYRTGYGKKNTHKIPVRSGTATHEYKIEPVASPVGSGNRPVPDTVTESASVLLGPPFSPSVCERD
jgi:hypothetical protein